MFNDVKIEAKTQIWFFIKVEFLANKKSFVQDRISIINLIFRQFSLLSSKLIFLLPPFSIHLKFFFINVWQCVFVHKENYLMTQRFKETLTGWVSSAFQSFHTLCIIKDNKKGINLMET